MGKRIIYLATQTLGFEVEGYPQGFVPRPLFKGQLNTVDEVEYITITETLNGELVANKALKLNDRFYMFNPETNSIEEHDLIEEGIEIVKVDATNIIRLEKNVYVRKFAFDCIREGEQESSPYQPIQGLPIDATYLSLKTHMFCEAKDEPKHEDLLHYQGRFWMVEDTRKSYYYVPKEKSVLHLTLKAINK